VRLKEAWHDSLVKGTVLGSLELLLVDITKFIANRGRHKRCTLVEALDEREHLWAQLEKDILVAGGEQTT